MKNSKSGFTLVELLIVIVVIVILATITLVTYKGATDRAYNAQILSGVQQYRDAMRAYYASAGRYPQTSREVSGQSIAMTCLGTGYPSGFCGKVTGVDTFEDATFNIQISSLIGTTPIVSSQNINVLNESFVGAVYGIDVTQFSSTGKARTIQYALLGTGQDCTLSGAKGYAISSTPPTTACEIILEETPADS